MNNWFTIDKADKNTYIISEYPIGRKRTVTCSMETKEAC